jgi:hypothetical protein
VFNALEVLKLLLNKILYVYPLLTRPWKKSAKNLNFTCVSTTSVIVLEPTTLRKGSPNAPEWESPYVLLMAWILYSIP